MTNPNATPKHAAGRRKHAPTTYKARHRKPNRRRGAITGQP